MRVERGLTFADQVWGRLAEAAERRPAAFVAVLVVTAFVVRIAATPFDAPPALDDVLAYALKAREIARGDWTPVHSHAIGWSLVVAPFLWPWPDASIASILAAARVVAAAVGALAVVPFAVLVRRTLDPPARVLALLMVPFALLLVRGAVRGLAEPMLTLALLGAVAGSVSPSRRALLAAGVAAGVACVVHPTGISVPVIAAVAAAVATPRRRLVAAVTVVAIALAVAAPAAIHRASVFGGPMDYGFNTRFFVEPSPDLRGAATTPRTMDEYLVTKSVAALFNRLVVRGVGDELWTFMHDVVHLPLVPFLLVGGVVAIRSRRLRSVLLALAIFLASWVPVYELYGNGRHLSPALSLALVLVAAGVGALTHDRRHAGAFMLAAAIAYGAGESTAAGIQRQRLGREDDTRAGLVWARWVAENVRGRLALPEGHALVMMHVADARIGGADIYTMSGPSTGLSLVWPGDFPTLATAFRWMRDNGVSHLLVDLERDRHTCFRSLTSTTALPPFLTEVYRSPPASRWPVRIVEIRWDRYAGVTSEIPGALADGRSAGRSAARPPR